MCPHEGQLLTDHCPYEKKCVVTCPHQYELLTGHCPCGYISVVMSLYEVVGMEMCVLVDVET